MADPPITVAQFQRTNRAPVFKDMWNHWTLLRTGRDNPSKSDVEQTLRAVMAKWFGSTDAASVLDPLLAWEGTTRSGSADLIKMKSAGLAKNTPMTQAAVPRSMLTKGQRLAGAAITRETAPGPVQFVASAGEPWRVRVVFAWRGNEETVPWPVWRSPWWQVTRDQALDPLAPKDWILEAVHAPTYGAPAELSTAGKLASSAGDVVLTTTNPAANATEQAIDSIENPAKFVAIAGGLLLIGYGIQQISTIIRRK